MPLAAVLLCFLLIGNPVTATSDTLPVPKPVTDRVVFFGTTALTAGGSLLALQQMWYKPHSSGRFHFFNDNHEWLQMDKLGHAYTAYQITDVIMQLSKHAGFNRKKSALIGGTSSFLYLSAIEVMDGFSRGWGFSSGDMLGNILGSTTALAQEWIWGEQKIRMKFSFHRSGLARFRPSLLGNSLSTEILKDYNGQSYWLSTSPAVFLKEKGKFPAWLCVSVGYGAFGMLSGHPEYFRTAEEIAKAPERIRQFYLSVDLDLSKIKTKSKLINVLLGSINVIKIPAPAIEFGKHGLSLVPLYY